MADSTLPAVPELTPVTVQVPNVLDNPYTIALLIDNVLYQKMQMTGQQAAMFLANPTFVQIDAASGVEGQIYDPATGTFSNPA